MMSIEQISESYIKKSRKPHFCDYCGDPIELGTSYYDETLKYDILYHWKSHPECHKVASALWEYISPWDGMGRDDYSEGVNSFYEEFICVDCEHNTHCRNHTYDDCPCGKDWWQTFDRAKDIYNLIEGKVLRNKKIDRPDGGYYFKWILEDAND